MRRPFKVKINQTEMSIYKALRRCAMLLELRNRRRTEMLHIKSINIHIVICAISNSKYNEVAALWNSLLHLFVPNVIMFKYAHLLYRTDCQYVSLAFHEYR